MASEEIIPAEDSYLDEGSASADRSEIDHLNYTAGGAGETNPVFRFDVSGMANKTWDSVILRLTYFAVGADPATGSNIWLGYITKAADASLNTTTWNEYTSGSAWDTVGAETDDDNDSDTRVNWPLTGAHAIGDAIQSPDITDIVNKAISDNGGILNLIMFGTGSNTNVQQYRSLETAGVPDSSFPTLVFANVQATTDASAAVTDTSLSSSESAALSSQSNRPPVSEPARQAIVSILHDGVEPMNILALMVKAEYGTDA